MPNEAQLSSGGSGVLNKPQEEEEEEEEAVQRVNAELMEAGLL